eukprot:CAMPEP_0172892632 /NCGR_PEP_ID=MMETSP1075-20121228/146563_1 /TAXON_ID=2916 /ORGANISM="Ceratium fusus, Strain PA161109" /LENGTH=69 /DNA_ID=CAMNT_0013747317 /DNA_START=159 /DNA_END=364 /DNA_ORIENTATION=+
MTDGSAMTSQVMAHWSPESGAPGNAHWSNPLVLKGDVSQNGSDKCRLLANTRYRKYSVQNEFLKITAPA